MGLNEQDKLRTVAQLADMFTTYSHEQVRELLVELNWDVQNCVDRLIIGHNFSNAATTSTKASTTKTADATPNKKSPIFNKEKCHVSQQSGAIPKNKQSFYNNRNNNNNSKNYVDNSSGKSNMSANAHTQININTSAASSPNKIRNRTNGSNGNSDENNFFNHNTYRATNNDFNRTCNYIKSGYRVLVIMRGAAGSGKSTLATKLLNQSVDWKNSSYYTINDYLLSTDDFFYMPNGFYNFSQHRLSDAHAWNQNRVLQNARNGLSPIIIDNTNMQIWEMMPYVKLGVQYNYIIEILEPNTNWCYSASKLAQKNTHQVSRESIQRALNRYEKTSASELIQMLKETKYTKSLPQMRLLPPTRQIIANDDIDSIKKEIEESKVNENLSVPIKQEQELFESSWSDYVDPNAPKGQRSKPRKCNKLLELEKEECAQEGDSDGKNNSVSNINENSQAWQPYEQESVSYWGNQSKSTLCTQPSDGKKSLLELLRESINEDESTIEEPQAASNEASMVKEAMTFSRHSIDCPNEDTGFISLRQMYPNKHIPGLWDLYVKCNGDVDWAVDILLREDEYAINSSTNDDYVNNDDLQNFCCKCLEQDEAATGPIESYGNVTADGVEEKLHPTNAARPHRQKISRRTNPELREIQLQIENQFKMCDDFYSEHTRKIRDIRDGTINTSHSFSNPDCTRPTNESSEDTLVEDDNEIPNGYSQDEDDCEGDIDGQQLIEFNLGDNLVKQLSNMFKSELPLHENLPENYTTNVFMPRALAKQLYMLWMESVYNQEEEKRQQTIREDAQFARLLIYPKFSEYKESPSNINELLEMKQTWNEYNSNKQIGTENSENQNNMARHISKMLLCERYPYIPRDTLEQVYEEKGYDYTKTLEVLGDDNEEAKDMNEDLTQDDYIKRAQQENDMLNEQAEAEKHAKPNNGADNQSKSSSQREESKRAALHEFEETRNMAAYHSQMKAECYRKAKEAIQKDKGGVAYYYSQIANLHKKRIDMCNHRAANCIMLVHELTQNNPDLLDLHYLHTLESITVVDLFLDAHISNLRSICRPYKNVFIITGRGLHSAGGIATIKNRVKSRLKQRSLKWREVNPGLLKVKIFPASKCTTNI